MTLSETGEWWKKAPAVLWNLGSQCDADICVRFEKFHPLLSDGGYIYCFTQKQTLAVYHLFGGNKRIASVLFPPHALRYKPEHLKFLTPALTPVSSHSHNVDSLTQRKWLYAELSKPMAPPLLMICEVSETVDFHSFRCRAAFLRTASSQSQSHTAASPHLVVVPVLAPHTSGPNKVVILSVLYDDEHGRFWTFDGTLIGELPLESDQQPQHHDHDNDNAWHTAETATNTLRGSQSADDENNGDKKRDRRSNDGFVHDAEAQHGVGSVLFFQPPASPRPIASRRIQAPIFFSDFFAEDDCIVVGRDDGECVWFFRVKFFWEKLSSTFKASVQPLFRLWEMARHQMWRPLCNSRFLTVSDNDDDCRAILAMNPHPQKPSLSLVLAMSCRDRLRLCQLSRRHPQAAGSSAAHSDAPPSVSELRNFLTQCHQQSSNVRSINDQLMKLNRHLTDIATRLNTTGLSSRIQSTGYSYRLPWYDCSIMAPASVNESTSELEFAVVQPANSLSSSPRLRMDFDMLVYEFPHPLASTHSQSDRVLRSAQRVSHSAPDTDHREQLAKANDQPLLAVHFGADCNRIFIIRPLLPEVPSESASSSLQLSASFSVSDSSSAASAASASAWRGATASATASGPLSASSSSSLASSFSHSHHILHSQPDGMSRVAAVPFLVLNCLSSSSAIVATWQALRSPKKNSRTVTETLFSVEDSQKLDGCDSMSAPSTKSARNHTHTPRRELLFQAECAQTVTSSSLRGRETRTVAKQFFVYPACDGDGDGDGDREGADGTVSDGAVFGALFDSSLCPLLRDVSLVKWLPGAFLFTQQSEWQNAQSESESESNAQPAQHHDNYQAKSASYPNLDCSDCHSLLLFLQKHPRSHLAQAGQLRRLNVIVKAQANEWQSNQRVGTATATGTATAKATATSTVKNSALNLSLSQPVPVPVPVLGLESESESVSYEWWAPPAKWMADMVDVHVVVSI